MSPTRNPESSFSLEDNPSPVPSGSTPSTATRARTTKRGFFVPLTEQGSLDIDRVRDTAGLEKARTALGVVDPSTLPPPEPVKINKEFITPAYSLLEVVIRFAGRKLLKWPEELAVEMRFSDEKKAALVEPTAAVLSRYAPTWLIENQDIAALTAALGDAVDDMIQGGVSRYQAKLAAAQQGTQPPAPQGVPMPPPIRREFTPVAMPSNGAGVSIAA